MQGVKKWAVWLKDSVESAEPGHGSPKSSDVDKGSSSAGAARDPTRVEYRNETCHESVAVAADGSEAESVSDVSSIHSLSKHFGCGGSLHPEEGLHYDDFASPF